MKKIVFTFGRFNPPTIGHAKLIQKVISIAKSGNAVARIYASQSQDDRKNPLPYVDKVKILRRIFPDVEFPIDTKIKIAFHAMSQISSEGFEDVTLVVGSDRVKDFKTVFSPYIKKKSDPDFDSRKHYDFKFKVVSAGERDPDAAGVAGMSASKMREFVKKDDINSFIKGFPSRNTNLARNTFNTIKRNLSENVEPVAIFVTGGPASGKDLIIRDLKETFSMKEVSPKDLSGIITQNLIVNGAPSDVPRAKIFLEGLGYSMAYVDVVINDESSKHRNIFRSKPLSEEKRRDKWKVYNRETAPLYESFEIKHVFDNSRSYKEYPKLIRKQLEEMKTSLNEQLDGGLKHRINNSYNQRKYQDVLLSYCQKVDEEETYNIDTTYILKCVTEQFGINSNMFIGWMNKNRKILNIAEKYIVKPIDTKYIKETGGAGDWGTPELTRRLKNDTPGQLNTKSKKKKRKPLNEGKKMYTDRRTAEKAAWEAAKQLNDMDATILVVQHEDDSFSVHRDQFISQKLKKTDKVIARYKARDVEDGVSKDPSSIPKSFKEYTNDR